MSDGPTFKRLMESIVWSPGIGDPSLGAWITVAAYFCVAILAFLAIVKALHSNDEKNAAFWAILCGLLLLLGFNKQLDLQSLLTEIGRYLARSEGWFEYRRTVQFFFVTSVGAAGLLALAIVAKRFWHKKTSVRWAVAGLFVQVFFVIIRAASFHHVDLFIDGTVLSLQWNLLIELIGIFMMGYGAALYRTERPSQVPQLK